MSLRALTIGVAAVGLIFGACGDGGGRFDDRVAAVRTAVASGDRTEAEIALDELEFAAGAAGADGAISEAESQEIAELIASSRALLDEVVPTTTASTTTTTAPAPTTTARPEKPGNGKPDDEGEDDRDDDDRGNGKKKGKDDD